MKKLLTSLFVAGLVLPSSLGWADVIDGLLPTLRLVADDLSATYNDGDQVLAWADRITAATGPNPLPVPIVLHNGPSTYTTYFPMADQTPHFRSGVMNGHDVVRFDDSNYELMSINPTLGATRDQLFNQLLKQGIGANVHYIPVHLHPFYRQYLCGHPECPVAEREYTRIISLPIFAGMSDLAVEKVITTIEQIAVENNHA